MRVQICGRNATQERKNASAFHSPPFYFLKIRQEPRWFDVSHMPNQPVAVLQHTALFQPATKKK